MLALSPISLKMEYEIDHSAHAMFQACDGTGKLPGTKCRMDGFDLETPYGGPSRTRSTDTSRVRKANHTGTWHTSSCWLDHMFATQLDESFVAHQYIIAAQAQSSVNVPETYWGCTGGPSDTVATITKQRKYGKPQVACFDYQTFGDELDTAKLPWRF